MLRRAAAWAIFLSTFLWLLVGSGDARASMASLWPSLIALGLAFLTRDVYLSLFAGAFSGAILLEQGRVVPAFLNLFAKFMVPALQDGWNVCVLIFTLLMGGLVEVLNRNGGMKALAERLLGRVQTRRRAGLGAYVMGWMLFFDGLANSMLVGKTMRASADRVGLSRAKLAFIVDSTSSPIAGLALISTWVAYEMAMIREGLPAGSSQGAAFLLLVQSLPYRFYNWFLLLLVFLSIWLGRDFRAMRQAEERGQGSGAVPLPGSPAREHGGRIFLALIPLASLVLAVIVGSFAEGGGFDQPLTFAGVVEAYGNANAALVFVWATAFAVGLAVLLSRLWPGFSDEPGPMSSLFEGMRVMFLPALILVFAWTLNGVIKEIGTASFLVSLLGSGGGQSWLPPSVFFLAALVSFCTGTSWGTMAIVMPLVIPLALQGEAPTPALVPTVGAVLAGAVFGDHCSPISDTTIVSAFSSECDLMEHVHTQLPYALVAATLAILAGYAPAGWGVSPYPLLVAGGFMCWVLIRYRAGVPERKK